MKPFNAVIVVLGSALLIFIGMLRVHAQSGGDRPSGAPAQRPRPVLQVQPLLDADGRIRDEAFVPGPALGAADRIYADIDGRRMKSVVNDVVAISRRSRDDGNRYWGRIAGTKYEAMTGDLIEAKFKSLRLVDVHRKEFPLRPQWFPVDWSLTAMQGGKSQTFGTVLPALSSVAIRGELDVDATWVGLGTAADFAGRDVRGKAVVFHTMLAPGEMGQSAVFEGTIHRAEEAGAVAHRYLGLLRQLRRLVEPRANGVLRGCEDSRFLDGIRGRKASPRPAGRGPDAPEAESNHRNA